MDPAQLIEMLPATGLCPVGCPGTVGGVVSDAAAENTNSPPDAQLVPADAGLTKVSVPGTGAVPPNVIDERLLFVREK